MITCRAYKYAEGTAVKADITEESLLPQYKSRQGAPNLTHLPTLTHQCTQGETSCETRHSLGRGNEPLKEEEILAYLENHCRSELLGEAMEPPHAHHMHTESQ